MYTNQSTKNVKMSKPINKWLSWVKGKVQYLV